MPLSITALRNHLASCEKPYYVRSSNAGTIAYDDLLDRLAEGRTTITKPDAMAAIQLLMMEMDRALADGFVVKLPFGAFYLVASGTLDSADQPFEYGDKEYGHDIRLHFRAEREGEKSLAARAELERAAIFDHQLPIVLAFESVYDDAIERTVGQGQYLRIHGQRLKFDPTDADLGISFRNGTEHRSPHYISVADQNVVALLPMDIPPGEYSIVTRTRPTGAEVKESVTPGLVVLAAG